MYKYIHNIWIRLHSPLCNKLVGSNGFLFCFHFYETRKRQFSILINLEVHVNKNQPNVKKSNFGHHPLEFMIFYNQKLNEKAFESAMYFDLLYISYLHIFRKRKKLGNSSVIRRSRKDYFFAEIYAPTTCINDLVSGSCLAQKITLDTHYNWIL